MHCVWGLDIDAYCDRVQCGKRIPCKQMLCQRDVDVSLLLNYSFWVGSNCEPTTGWITIWRIAVHSGSDMLVGTSSQTKIFTPVNQILDDHIIQMLVKIDPFVDHTASTAQIRANIVSGLSTQTLRIVYLQ